jgi:hypothetical protein
MATAPVETLGMQGGGVEKPQAFMPTPERVSQFLELKTEEVRVQMKSAEGRKQLLSQLTTHIDDLQEAHPDINPLQLSEQLDLVGETLVAEDKFMKKVNEPEKKGLFTRVWESVKSFPGKHPWVTTGLVLASIFGGVAGAYYLAGGWEALATNVGLGHLFGAEGAGAAAETMGEIIDGSKEIPNYFDGPGGDMMR